MLIYFSNGVNLEDPIPANGINCVQNVDVQNELETDIHEDKVYNNMHALFTCTYVTTFAHVRYTMK